MLTLCLLQTPHQSAIAPLVESDYAYQLIAADRLHAGHGLTSLQPVAPHQPWAWHRDWAYLTQWPAGYPLLVAGVRTLLGGTSLDAARVLSAAACAFALVGWFALLIGCTPAGFARYGVAAVTAALVVSASSLINPSTDALVLALLPWLMLAVLHSVSRGMDAPGHGPSESSAGWRRFALLGLAAGMLCWIRYAAVFIPVGIGLYLIVGALHRRRPSFGAPAAYAGGCAVPVLALVAINHTFAATDSLQSQLNLGTGFSFDFSLALVVAAWSQVTDLGLYDHRPLVHAGFAIWPVLLAVILLLVPRARSALARSPAMPAVGLGAALIAVLLVMLIAATALFGEKYDYAMLPRYYLPGRVLYCVAFGAPLLLLRRRVIQLALCGVCILALVWIVQVEWSRPLQRWHEAGRPRTPSGAWSRAFEPGAADLLAWLQAHEDPSLILVSNFHEFLTLETGIPALPIPPDADTLDRWTGAIESARGITSPTVLFVLDPDNKWRDYWIPNPQVVVEAFSLRHLSAKECPTPQFVLCAGVEAKRTNRALGVRPGRLLGDNEGDLASIALDR